jgi:basic amino acid/polyamine antiporter, APA family
MAAQQEVKRTLGFWVALSIVIGGVIGSGIFKKPAVMASQLGSAEWLIAVWVVAGIVTLFGALTTAEIAGMIPETGGQFMFFKKVYGNFTGFIYGWALFSVIQSGSIASITYIFAEYAGYFVHLPRFSVAVEQSVVLHLPGIGNIFPLQDIGTKALTIITIWLLTSINFRGAKLGGGIQVIFTALKLFAIVFIIGMVFGWGSNVSAPSLPVIRTVGTVTLVSFMAAMSGAFWGYDGWNNLTYIAGEIKNPQRNIVRALFFGLLTVIAVYVTINFAYLYVFDIKTMAQSKLVASDVAVAVAGIAGGAIVAAAIMMSTFGAANGSVMSSARVYFAMAREKLFFKKIGVLHPKYETPHNSLLLQATWASLLVLSGTFDILTDMLVFVAWIFYSLSALSVILLRMREPETPRPYKVWGYPFIPIIFILISTTFLVVTLYDDISKYYAGETQIINSVFGLAIVALGIPFYFYFSRRGVGSVERGE